MDLHLRAHAGHSRQAAGPSKLGRLECEQPARTLAALADLAHPDSGFTLMLVSRAGGLPTQPQTMFDAVLQPTASSLQPAFPGRDRNRGPWPRRRAGVRRSGWLTVIARNIATRARGFSPHVDFTWWYRPGER